AAGVVHFGLPDAQGRTRVYASLTGLPPSTTLAMHVHQWGDDSSADGASAGGHFNPHNVSHALPPAAPRHMGDLGNVIVTDANGAAQVEALLDLLSLSAASGNIIGRAVVVHQRHDDGTTQPTGDAGGRLMVGVVGVSAQAMPPATT